MRKNVGKLLVSLSALVMMFSLAGCGSTASSAAAATSSAAASSAAATSAVMPTKLEGNWADTYDKLIGYAKVETNSTKRFKIMHKAEDLLMSTGALCPIYYYTDQYLLNSHVKDMAYSPMGYKLFTFASRDDGKTTIDACIASEPGTIDPALNNTVDGANYVAHSFIGLYKLGYDGNGGVKTEPGCATGYTTKANADGSTTYDFTMRAGLKWSDGTTLDANDFVYSWNRAASGVTGSPYSYLFDVVGNGPTVEADTTGKEVLDISASTDGTHFYATLPVDSPLFLTFCAFATFNPVQKATVEANDVSDVGVWATKPSTYITDGPYRLKSWTANSSMVFEKNPYYYDAANVKITEINYHLADDDTAIYASFEAGELDLADSFPTSQIDAIKAKYTPLNEYYNMPNLGTYYYEFNVNEAAANTAGYAVIADTEEKRANFRRGLALLIDRNHLVNDITKGGQVPANTFVGSGVTDEAVGSDFAADANGGQGYYSVATDSYAANVTKAIELIKSAGFTYDTATKKFTNVPAVKFSTNTSTGHTAIATEVQAEYAAVGITLDIQQAADWKTAVADRTAGQYECSRAGWLCDYNDPMNMLEMWTTSSGNNDCQFGRNAHAAYTGYSVDLSDL
jgi:ABC-type oligopeptide transport system substrate-binding subunit